MEGALEVRLPRRALRDPRGPWICSGRPKVRARDLLAAGDGDVAGAPEDVLAAVEVELKYEGYVVRERERAHAGAEAALT